MKRDELLGAIWSSDVQKVRTILRSRNVKLNRLHKGDNFLSVACLQPQPASKDIVTELLGHGANPNIRNYQGETPLFYACRNDSEFQIDIIEELLRNGAVLNTKAFHRITPIHLVAEAVNTKLLEFFIGKGADVWASTECGTTPLEIVCKKLLEMLHYFWYENETAVPDDFVSQTINFSKQLLEANAHPAGVGDVLGLACQSGVVELVDLMILHGADVNRWQETPGGMPLQLACLSDLASIDMVKRLIVEGAEVNPPDMDFFPEAPLECVSPLHAACSALDVDKVLLLLSWGATVNHRCDGIPLVVLLADMEEPERLLLIEVCLALGATVTHTDFRETGLYACQQDPTSRKTRELLNGIRSRPRSLSQLCRPVIWDNMRLPKCSSVLSLPLPLFLKDFLLLDDVFRKYATCSAWNRSLVISEVDSLKI